MRYFAGAIAVGIAALISTAGMAQDAIDRRSLSADTRFLASDLLRGRDTGSPGQEIAAAYVASRCAAMGLLPVNGTYIHPVPMTRAVLTGATALLRSREGVAEYPNSAIPNFIKAGTPISFSGPLVFIDLQSGRTSADASVSGAVGVVTSVLRAPSIDSLAALGLVGLVQLLSDQEAFDRYRVSRGPSRLYLDAPGATSAFAGSIPTVIAAPDLANAIIRSIRTGGEIAIDFNVTTEGFASSNVACLLPGTEPATAQGAIALSAHLDHLGVGAPDESGDSIYNGFSDNASGVAMLLEIARVLTTGPRIRHDVVLLFFTGEERGLLGSEYMASNPIGTDNGLVGLINLDAGAPPAPPGRWEVVGGEESELGATALEVAARHGWGVRSSSARPNSDFYPFHRAGVPAIFIIPGRRPYEGFGEVESEDLFRRWDAYHQPGDEWSADFPFSGLVRYAEYALAVLREYDARLVR